ncbi:NAD(P)H-hydrate epimerase [Rubripirellula reticaptiva]|uniref:NAD(P)H-hydrate epimerase n=1 Tax=Rubripirellula reticaptiva TaxID=2528013 RepID=A0A5C6EQB9_9BACT|nr:NAD(P)H-hydrate epimerase [Rubripirellula reticaptiva]TWU49761.1 Bifunctional NAD(P)H-hydrate repair enzyme Nnr [Rubripirellula reticaptiva]
MSISPLTRDQVRRVDEVAIRDYGLLGVVLMENAGRGAAEIINRLAPQGPIAILCGKGNNGGDGYVIARHLELSGRQVEIFSVVDPRELSGDAATNAAIAFKAEIRTTKINDASQINQQSWSAVVDCLLGTGATGSLRGIYAGIVDAANSVETMRFAIDVPTGLDCDTGAASIPTFIADHTITFVASKVGFEIGDASTYVGTVHEVGIGVPAKLLREIAKSS